MSAAFETARAAFHTALCSGLLTIDSNGVPSNADKHNPTSVALAKGILARIGIVGDGTRLAAQTVGTGFERLCADFLRQTFLELSHLRPGNWDVRQVSGRSRNAIAEFEQYAHLTALEAAAKEHPHLASILGSDYTITPDIIVARTPEPDEHINATQCLVNEKVATASPLRLRNNPLPILHASISCKWTIRSDRAQNSRSEALNLIRHRKGSMPHVAVITAEPLPARLAALALGTGDINCVYHFALNELVAAADDLGAGDAQEMLNIMIDGRRLRDLSDLPLDLAV